MSIEAMKQALEALELALRSHGVLLLSDPPQDAWKTYGVEANARQSITALRTAIEEAEKREWVGLTADEMEGLYQLATYMDETDPIHMLMMAEAKLKEKNT